MPVHRDDSRLVLLAYDVAIPCHRTSALLLLFNTTRAHTALLRTSASRRPLLVVDTVESRQDHEVSYRATQPLKFTDSRVDSPRDELSVNRAHFSYVYFT